MFTHLDRLLFNLVPPPSKHRALGPCQALWLLQALNCPKASLGLNVTPQALSVLHQQSFVAGEGGPSCLGNRLNRPPS